MLRGFEQALKEMGATIPTDVGGPPVDLSHVDERFLKVENSITLLQTFTETLFSKSEADLLRKKLLEIEKLLKQKANNEDVDCIQNQVDLLNKQISILKTQISALDNETAKKSDIIVITQQIKIIELAIAELQKAKPRGSNIDESKINDEINELKKQHTKSTPPNQFTTTNNQTNI